MKKRTKVWLAGPEIPCIMFVRKYTYYGCQKLRLLPSIYHAHHTTPRSWTAIVFHDLVSDPCETTHPGVPAFQNRLREVVLCQRKQVQNLSPPSNAGDWCWFAVTRECSIKMHPKKLQRSAIFVFVCQKSRVEAWLVTTVNPEAKY